MARRETAGIDFPLRHVLGATSIAKVLKGGPECTFGGEWGLSYQKCRSCDRGMGELVSMIKYGVRHYICHACRDYYVAKGATHGTHQ
jgi:hypothetical protein